MSGHRILRLQISTAGAWRDVIAIDRADEIACAYALASAPLLARAATHSAELRIVDNYGRMYCTWDVLDGWIGTIHAPLDGVPEDPITQEMPDDHDH